MGWKSIDFPAHYHFVLASFRYFRGYEETMAAWPPWFFVPDFLGKFSWFFLGFALFFSCCLLYREQRVEKESSRKSSVSTRRSVSSSYMSGWCWVSRRPIPWPSRNRRIQIYLLRGPRFSIPHTLRKSGTRRLERARWLTSSWTGYLWLFRIQIQGKDSILKLKGVNG